MQSATPITAALAVFAFAVAPAAANEWSRAVADGTASFDFRYRFEGVDQDGVPEDAAASTLRSRFTWTSAQVQRWSMGLEADYVAVIGGERYNSTENGRTRYPVVADPEGLDLNQAFVKYRGDAVTLTGGRQRILHGDQRFVGGVGWRQNEQTYDAVRAEFEPAKGLTVDYGYVWNVNRIFGPDDGAQPADWRSDAHLLTAGYAIAEGHTLSGYAYLLDFDNDNGIPNSTETYGVAYSGKLGPVRVNATYALQSDYGDSPLDYDAPYYSVDAAIDVAPVTLRAGWAVLGSDDGVAAFRTPLATLHKWQGWADQFLATPAAGIEDLHVGVDGALGPVQLTLTWHDFSADEGGADYGNELDLAATWPVTEQVSLQLKLADYDADGFATDTTKGWLSVVVRL